MRRGFEEPNTDQAQRIANPRAGRYFSSHRWRRRRRSKRSRDFAAEKTDSWQDYALSPRGSTRHSFPLEISQISGIAVAFLQRRDAFENTHKPQKYAEDVKAEIHRLLVECPIPRDALPYSDQFPILKTKYQASLKTTLSDHEFWQLLSKIGKYGGAAGAGGRKYIPPTKSLTEEQQLEMLRLFPDGIGHRDNLPYTPEFDDRHKEFEKLTRLKLTKHEFWRALSRVAKLSRKPKPLFETAPLGGLQKEVVESLERMNPHWRAQFTPPLERFRRHAFREVLSRLDQRVAPVVAVRGPRQVGKTTIQLQLVEELLLIRHVKPACILRVQFDDTPSLGTLGNPVEAIVRWYEDNILKEPINAVVARGEQVYLFFDELQNVRGWSAQLKSLADHAKASILITGSSALRISRGQDNLAGRVSPIQLGPLNLSEIAGVRKLGDLPMYSCINSVHEDWAKIDFWRGLNEHAKKYSKVLRAAFRAFSEVGGYPICHKPGMTATTAGLAKQLIGDVVNKSIDHDPAKRGKKGQLNRSVIKEVFRLVCRYAGQSPRYREIATQITEVMGSGVKEQEVIDSIDFLEDALLIHCVRPLELFQKKHSAAPKLCLCDHFVRNAWLQEEIPLDPAALAKLNGSVSGSAGNLIESIVGYHLVGNPNTEVAWFPPRNTEPEIDFVVTLGLKRLPIEVKYQKQVTSSDWRNIRAFCERPHYAAAFGVVLTQEIAGDLGPLGIAVPTPNFLLTL